MRFAQEISLRISIGLTKETPIENDEGSTSRDFIILTKGFNEE